MDLKTINISYEIVCRQKGFIDNTRVENTENTKKRKYLYKKNAKSQQEKFENIFFYMI